MFLFLDPQLDLTMEVIKGLRLADVTASGGGIIEAQLRLRYVEIPEGAPLEAPLGENLPPRTSYLEASPTRNARCEGASLHAAPRGEAPQQETPRDDRPPTEIRLQLSKPTRRYRGPGSGLGINGKRNLAERSRDTRFA